MTCVVHQAKGRTSDAHFPSSSNGPSHFPRHQSLPLPSSLLSALHVPGPSMYGCENMFVSIHVLLLSYVSHTVGHREDYIVWTKRAQLGISDLQCVYQQTWLNDQV